MMDPTDPGALEDEPVKQPAVSAIYIVKYNRFVDSILEKMNDILRKSYDPVSVKLQPIDASKKGNKPKKNKKKNNKRKSAQKKKNTARAGIEDNTQHNVTTTDIIENNTELNMIQNGLETEQNPVQNSTNTQPRATKPNSNKVKATPKPKPSKTTPKPTKKTPVKSTTKKPVVKKPNKTKSEKSKPRAKGILYGLSSLRRSGDVAVSILADHTSVKSNFAVGPLILKVEKEVGRGAKKELKSATATTAEMMGKLTLRVNNDGIATLHSIKVLQPKQVRVDSNHERTRKLVWERSARIAHMVSQKLLVASKPVLNLE